MLRAQKLTLHHLWFLINETTGMKLTLFFSVCRTKCFSWTSVILASEFRIEQDGDIWEMEMLGV